MDLTYRNRYPTLAACSILFSSDHRKLRVTHFATVTATLTPASLFHHQFIHQRRIRCRFNIIFVPPPSRKSCVNPNLGRFTRPVSRRSPASPQLSVKNPRTCFYDDTVIWTRPSENSVIHFSHRVLCRDPSSLPCCIRPLTLLSQLLWLKVCYNRHPTNSATLQRRHISLPRSVPDSDLQLLDLGHTTSPTSWFPRERVPSAWALCFF